MSKKTYIDHYKYDDDDQDYLRKKKMHKPNRQNNKKIDDNGNSFYDIDLDNNFSYVPAKHRKK